MFEPGVHIDHTSLAHRVFLRSDSHLRLTADQVINFVLTVRILRIRCSGGQNIDSGAHGGNAKEFEVGAATPKSFRRQLIERKNFRLPDAPPHPPLKKISWYLWAKFSFF